MWSFFLEFPQILLSQRLNKMTTSAVLWIYIKVLLRIQVTLFTIKHKLELALIPRLSSLVHPVLIDLFCHQSLQLPWCIIQECQSQWGRISRSQVSPQLHSLMLHKCKPLKANSPHSWTLTSVEQGRHSIKISILQLPIFGATVLLLIWLTLLSCILMNIKTVHHWLPLLIAKKQPKADSPQKNNSADNILQEFKAHLNSLAAALCSMNDSLTFSMLHIYYNLSKNLIVVIKSSFL